MQKILKDESGTVLIEFAFVGILFLAIILAFINFAFLFNCKVVTQQAAREAARAVATMGVDHVLAETAKSTVIQKAGLTKESDVSVSIGTQNRPGIGGQYTYRDNVSKRENIVTATHAYATINTNAPVLVPGFAVLVGGKVWQTIVPMEFTAIYPIEKQHYEFDDYTEFAEWK